MSQQNKALARQIFEEIQSKGNLGLIDQLVSADYVGHTPLLEIHGPAGARQFDAVLKQAFPDYQATVEGQIAEGDLVATRWTGRGTHRGPFRGIPATGKPITLAGMTFFRIANGKLVEGWTNIDLAGVLQQIGAMPTPEQRSQAVGA